jgi:hypothetical protein
MFAKGNKERIKSVFGSMPNAFNSGIIASTALLVKMVLLFIGFFLSFMRITPPPPFFLLKINPNHIANYHN